MENKKFELNEKQLEYAQETLASMEFNELREENIIDNTYPFFVNDQMYRARMPNNREFCLVDKYKEDYKQNMIMTEKVYKLDTWKKILKDQQGIDIDELESQRTSLQNKLTSEYLVLTAIHPDLKDRINESKSKIAEIEDEHLKLFCEITEWLSPCLEYKLDDVYGKYLTYLCTEKLENSNSDKWVKLWNKYEEFEEADRKLVNNSIKHMLYLVNKRNA